MSMISIPPQLAACECGACQMEVSAGPAARLICHCTICQAFTGRPFSDVVMMRARSVVVRSTENIEFKKYRLPPNTLRGLCKRCGKPAIELGGIGPTKFAIIPTPNFSHLEWLPPVAMHIFYHRRQKDSSDCLPKYSGYFPSELAVIKLLFEIF
jgi:hypothetical protein